MALKKMPSKISRFKVKRWIYFTAGYFHIKIIRQHASNNNDRFCRPDIYKIDQCRRPPARPGRMIGLLKTVAPVDGVKIRDAAIFSSLCRRIDILLQANKAVFIKWGSWISPGRHLSMIVIPNGFEEQPQDITLLT
ncbi:MAG: hypothetical protein JW943_15285 [Deltaproteobacteria bacterium]|nr:hypothetical protein [Deltaproteobacteria bacterium]